MRNINCILTLAVLLACSSSALAQAGKPPLQVNVSETLDSWIMNTERHVVSVADVMPEDKYSFAPAQTSGEFKNVRTFAQQLKHLAANNYCMAVLILGNKVSAEIYNETGPASVRTKAEIMDYLKGLLRSASQSGYDDWQR